MQTEGGLGQLLHPLSGTDKILVRDSLYQALPRYQFIPDVLQLVSGVATSLSQFIRSCHLFHLATWSLEAAHLIFSQLQCRKMARVLALVTTLVCSPIVIKNNLWPNC